MELARKFRPKSVDEIIGQKEVVESFRKFIKFERIPHSLFFGPAGCGKTTLAKAVAKDMKYDFYEFDGANFKSDEIRKVLAKFNGGLLKPLIFIDEFHRLSKTQQETLLIPMESGNCVIMGATTENPKFVVSSGIRSRMMIFEFGLLSRQDLANLADFVINELKINIEDEAKKYLINSSGGDGRSLLNLLDFARLLGEPITLNSLKTLRPSSVGEGVASSDVHYDLISPFIKSMRGSDVDAALYYLARMINAGEEPAFIARRMVIFASEDIGNANPNALNLAVSTMQAVSKIGYPEARIILSQCVVYLSHSPKSNSSYEAINEAIKFSSENEPLPIPKYLINSAKEIENYLYPHDFGGWVEQKYLSKELKFYKSKGIGFEKTLDEWIKKIKSIIK